MLVFELALFNKISVWSSIRDKKINIFKNLIQDATEIHITISQVFFSILLDFIAFFYMLCYIQQSCWKKIQNMQHYFFMCAHYSLYKSIYLFQISTLYLHDCYDARTLNVELNVEDKIECIPLKKTLPYVIQRSQMENLYYLSCKLLTFLKVLLHYFFFFVKSVCYKQKLEF